MARGLDPGTYRVQVKDLKGRLVAWADPADPAQPDKPVELVVEDGVDQTGVHFVIENRDGVIRGTVVDADGAPLPDAWVTAVRDQALGRMLGAGQDDENVIKAREKKRDEDDTDPRGTELPMWFAETPVLTDPSGNFVIEDLKDGAYSLIAEGMRGSARARKDDVKPGDVVNVQLERLAGIRGRATQGGKPVTEYSVSLKGPSDRSKTVRNPEGTFLVDRIDPGAYTVRVQSASGTGEAEVEVEEGRTAEVAVSLQGFGRIEGRLVNGQTGEPIAGASVNVWSRDSQGFDGKAVMAMFTGMGPRTGKDGRFEVGEVRPGKNSVMFRDRDAAVSGSEIASHEFEIEAEQTKDLGDIKGLPVSDVPADKRGELGMRTRVASRSDRPLAPDADEDEDEDDDDSASGHDPTPRLWVFSITKDGPAAEAGVEPGDEIVAVDGRDVSGLGAETAHMMLSASRMKGGQTVSLEIDRDGSRRSVSVEAKAKDEDEAGE